MSKPGRPGGMVQRRVVVTPALQNAAGMLKVRDAASLLGITGSQVYRWLMDDDLPHERSGGRSHALKLDAATLRRWIEAVRPLVWEPQADDVLACDNAEYDRRLAACRARMARW